MQRCAGLFFTSNRRQVISSACNVHRYEQNLTGKYVGMVGLGRNEVRRCEESDTEYFQDCIHDALDAPSGDAAASPDIRQFLINVDAGASGEGIIE